MLLCHKLGVEPPCPANLIGSMATLPLPDGFQGRSRNGKIDSEQTALYDKYAIEVPFFRRGQPETRYFRISTHVYNSLAEYDYLGETLRSFGSADRASSLA
jgi:isopenicillin-N epimerase